MRRDGPMKFEEDFDFETANAQFHKDDIDKELQSKLKLKGKMSFCSLPQAQVHVCLFIPSAVFVSGQSVLLFLVTVYLLY